MLLNPVPLLVLFLSFLNTFIAATQFTADVSVNCGSTGTSAARNGRVWRGDVLPKFSSLLLQIMGSSTTSTVIHKLTSADDPVPYKTARLSRSGFSYAFQLNPGQKMLRLHFNPSPYRGFKRFRDFFTVEAGPFILLSNFSASLTADALGVSSFVKEYCINIEQNQEFAIFFLPANTQSLDTYAFINGIEIISVPPILSYFHGGDLIQEVYVDNTTALETIRRLNIKQDSLSSADDDIGDVFQMWEMVPKGKENKDNNITWKVSVDVGFRYLIRLHFSKIGFKMAEVAGVMFNVRINEMIVDTTVVRGRDDENSIPWYRDYMVMMKGRKQDGKRHLLICLESDDEFMDGHGPLKGFEIMKLSNHDNSLASPNPLPPSQYSSHGTIQKVLKVLGHRNKIAAVAITVLALINIIVYTLKQYREASCAKEENILSAKAERLCRRFSLVEIQSATRNFSDAHLIGRGGFGKVYRGLIDNGQETVAIKRLKSNSKQGAREFLTEIETLTELRHINLVSLIGYCNEHGEMILVYEYMAGGTLADHLYKLARNNNNGSSLNWKQRLNICIGAGRGLDYLHTGHSLIHRDIKASNILMDENFTAKVADFGLAKHLSKSKSQSHVSTRVKGTFGYFDPNYLTTGKLTRKSDTYAFGVVLLEVLSGRPALDYSRVAEDERVLTKWALENISMGKTDQIVASNLRGEITKDSLKVFVEVAERCLHDEPKKRPTMAQVVLQLEFALEQQESSRSQVPNLKTSNVEDIHRSDKETNFSVSTGQLTMASTDMQNHIPPPNVQTDSKVVYAKPSSGRKARTHKPSKRAQNKILLLLKPVMFSIRERSKDTSLKIFSLMIKKPEDLAFLEKEDGLASLDIIGRGGCGEVYKAVLPGSNGKEIAIKKIIQPFREAEDLIEDDERLLEKQMRQIKSEIQTVGQIRHRNLLPLLAHLSRPHCHYLVYEYMKNGTLQDCLDLAAEGGIKLDWLARYKIALGVAAGLEHLHLYHNPLIIHRDLKPGNILLDDKMEARITDFGLATAVPDAYTHVTASNVVGTIGYIAPEYYQSFKFTDKCDIYSFGVVLGVLVMGKLPSDEFFQYTNEMSLVRWMRNVMTSEEQKIAIDPKLSGEGYEEQMLLVLKIACLCTLDDPKERPNSRDVRVMLSQVKH